MAHIEVIGTIKLEPSVIKPEPTVVEIYPDDVFQSSDKDDCEEDNSENKIVDVAIDEDIHIDNDFCTNENLREDECLVLNYSKQVLPRSNDVKEISNCKNVDWAKYYKTNQLNSCLEDQRKVLKTYGSSWSKPIHHKEYTYISETLTICNYCQRKFKGQQYLARHIRVLHRESSVTYHCPYCPAQSKWDLSSHILLKHKNENEVTWFQCYQCDKKFRMKHRLVRHIQSHLGIRKKSSATCPTCGKVFNSKHSMKVHAEKNHEKKHQCDKCSFIGQSLGALKYHIEICHMDPDELPIHQCSQCNFKTRFKHLYKQHYKRHVTSYVCEKCGFMSNTSVSFKLHKNIHKEEMDDKTLRYHCNKCDYKTYRMYSLQIHKLNHLKPEEIKYFYCYHCNFKANRKDNLKTHIMRHFKKEEVTFQCFICDFSTKKRGTLTEHISRHQKSPQTKENSAS